MVCTFVYKWKLTFIFMQMSPITSLHGCDSVACISGRGPATSRIPDTLSFNVDANQFVLGSTLVEDIAVHCFMNSRMDQMATLAELPLPMSYVYFSGVLFDCEDSNDSHREIKVALIDFSVLD